MTDPHELTIALLNDTTTPHEILTTFTKESNNTAAWLNFLHHDDNLDDFSSRNEFIQWLISNPSPETFSILAILVELHCEKNVDTSIILFGRDFVEEIAQSLVSFFPAGQSLLRALLLPTRSRNEASFQEVREWILLPLSQSHPVVLAEVLMESVLQSVLLISGGDEEEVAMKRETAALSKLQDVREVVEIVARYCVECFNGENDEEEGERIVKAFNAVYEEAPFALESQLETLLDEDSACILGRLTQEQQQEEIKEVEMGETLPPIYASLSGGPLHLSSSQLEVTLAEIHDKLSLTDAERWDERLSALTDLQRILASSLQKDRYLFIDKLRKMPLPDQFSDLRSQVTHAACRVLVCTCFEYRTYIEEDPSLTSILHQFIENCLPALMKLCTSGTRLMANQGVNCLQSLCTFSTGHVRLLNALCEEILDKKSKNNNRKRGAVMGLTSALRVWNESCFKGDTVGKAVKEANGNKDPGVREEGRKAYWGMVSCPKLKSKGEELYPQGSREYKNLLKCREECDAEWKEGGKMWVLLNTGVFGEDCVKGKSSTGAAGNKAGMKVPPRSTTINKRPISAGTRDKSTPVAKAGRFSTPAKAAGAANIDGSSSKRPASATVRMSTPAGGSRLPTNTPSSRRTVAASSAPRTNTLKTPSTKTERNSISVVNSRNHTGSSRKPVKQMPNKTTPSNNVIRSAIFPDPIMTTCDDIHDEKENSPKTPTNTTQPTSSPKVGTPVVSLLARPSPLSIEKCRSRNALSQVVTMLSDTRNPSEQYIGIQVLALFAKENSDHASWNDMFGVVLELLLGLTKNTQTESSYDSIHFARSPSKTLGSRYEAQHIFLQGIRSLLQFVPNRFEEKQVKEVMDCLLECTNAPFEIVHTCERALQNLVTCTNPGICFECLLLHLSDNQVDLDSEDNPPVLLSALRTLKHIIEFLPLHTLRHATPDLLQLFHTTIQHKSVDMRKATVFILVEMYCILGKELNIDGFNEGQRRLIDVYVRRHPRNAMVL